MATVTRPRTPPGVVLEDVPWADYEAQLRIIGDRHIRVNYDSGRMEIMSPLRRHGNDATRLGRMVDALAEELDIPTQAADPVTLKRPDLAKGIEPDRLFHFGANAVAVQDDREFDFTVNPPPDLVIEVDMTSSSVPRLPIFAALGIPEVWRVEDDENSSSSTSRPTGPTAPGPKPGLPRLLVAEAARFLEQGQGADNRPPGSDLPGLRPRRPPLNTRPGRADDR